MSADAPPPKKGFLEKAVHNSAWTGIGSLGRAVLNVVFAGVTIRWLGLAEAGFVLALLTLIEMYVAVTNFGFSSAAVRFTSEAHASGDREKMRRVVNTCLAASFFSGLGFFLLVWLGADSLVRWTKYSGDLHVARLFCALMGLSALGKMMAFCFSNVLEACQQFAFLTKRTLSFDLASGVLGIVGLSIFPSILTVGVITLLLALINLTVVERMTKQVIGFLPAPRWSVATAGELWGLGRWYYLSSWGTMLQSQLDRVLVTSFLGSAALPLYTMARRPYDIGNQILVSQSSYLFPMLSASGAEKAALMDRIEVRLRWFIAVVTAWYYGAVILVGPAALDLLVGKQFGTKISLNILCFALVGTIHAQNIVPWFFCFASDRVRITTFFPYVSAAIILPALYFLSRRFGATGAAMAQLGIGVSVLLMHWLYWRAPRGLGWLLRFARPLVAPLGLLALVTVAGLFESAEAVSVPVRLGVGGLFSLLFLPAVVRLEMFLFPSTEGPGTLRRALEKLSAKLPIPGWFTNFAFGGPGEPKPASL